MKSLTSRRLLFGAATLIPATMAGRLFAQTTAVAGDSLSKMIAILTAELQVLKKFRPGLTTNEALPKGMVGESYEVLGATVVTAISELHADVIFDRPGAPILSLPPGVWFITGGTCLSSVQAPDAMTLRLFSDQVFGGGSSVGATATDVYLPGFCSGVLRVTGKESKVYLYGQRNGNSQIRLGQHPMAVNIPSGWITAVRIA